MKKFFLALLSICALYGSADAADRIRIGYPDNSGSFSFTPVGTEAGFLSKGRDSSRAHQDQVDGCVDRVGERRTRLSHGDRTRGRGGDAGHSGQANRYISQNREGTLQVMMEWMRIDREMAAATYDGIVKTYSDDLSLPEDGLKLLIDEAKKNDKVNREVSIDQVADLSLLKEVQKELGIINK